MRDFLRRIRLPLLFAGLLLITVVLMVGDRRTVQQGGVDHSLLGGLLLEVAAPFQKAVIAPVDWLGEVWTRYVALVEVREENERLRARIAELEDENLQFREALVASGNLDRIVEMRAGFEVPLLPAQVVGHDVSGWFHSVLLDRGRSSKVLSGMPVVNDHGLVGVVTATTPRASRTMMLLDRRSAADAIVQRSRARGIVYGTGGETLRFVFMVRGDDVREGDLLITSGMGGVHPKGVRLGEVTAVQKDRNQLLHTATVRPAVDFGRIEQVFVLLRRGPTMDLLYERDGDVPGEAEDEP